jgi:hypothetical protein
MQAKAFGFKCKINDGLYILRHSYEKLSSDFITGNP